MSRSLIALPFRYRPWRRRHLRLILRDLQGAAPGSPRDAREHLAAAIDWLCLAQDVRNGMADSGGVSAGYSFEDGWLPSYPETSGYIVETFIAAARVLERPELIDRAHRIVDWELCIQHPDGAFPGTSASRAAGLSSSTPGRSCTACWPGTFSSGAPSA